MSAVGAARTGLVAVGVLVGIVSASRAYDVEQPWVWGSDLAVTVAYCVVAAMALPASSRRAILAAAVAASWAIVAWLPFATYWHRGVLIHLLVVLLVASSGVWPRRRRDRAVIAMGYVVSVTPFVWRADAAAIVLSIALVAAGFLLRPHNSGAASGLASGALVTFAVLVAAGAVVHAAALGVDALEVRAVVYAIGMLAVAVMAGLAVRPRPVGPAADAAIELGARPDDAVRDRLAAALGDRSLTVGWWMPQLGVFQTAGGVEVMPPATGGDRAEVIVDIDGRPVARVVGSAARLDEGGVREAIRRAAHLTTENERLTGLLREAARDVERSRARLIRAADAERRTLARELDEEVGEPLQALRAALVRSDGASASPGSRALALADRALAELSDISQGLDPSALGAGLADALEVLTARMPIPVALDVDDDIDDPAARVAYYVCAEAVANAVRHAECGSIRVRVMSEDRLVVVSVEDDGRGGAAVRQGSGLAGLATRVAVAGGTVAIASPPGGGTSVRVTLPLERTAVDVEMSQ